MMYDFVVVLIFKLLDDVKVRFLGGCNTGVPQSLGDAGDRNPCIN